MIRFRQSPVVPIFISSSRGYVDVGVRGQRGSVVEQVLNRDGVGVTRKSVEVLGEMIVQIDSLVDNKIKNCQGGKLLGQRSQIEDRIGCYFCPRLQIRIAVAVKVHELLVHPDRHGDTRKAIAIMWVDQVGDDLVDQRLLGPGVWVYLKKLEQVLLFLCGLLSKPSAPPEGGLNAATRRCRFLSSIVPIRRI